MHTKNKAKQKQKKKKTEKDGTKKWPLSQSNIINRHLKVCGKQGEEEPKLERGRTRTEKITSRDALMKTRSSCVAFRFVY